MTWTLHLPIDLPSANRNGGAATNARHAANAAMYRRQRAQYVSALAAAMREAGIGSVNLLIDAFDCPRRRVTVVRLWGKGCRAWDDDNLVAACKGLRDACQRARTVTRMGIPVIVPGAGLVWDDSAKWSEWSYAQRKSDDGKPGVLLIVSDASEEKP